MKKLSYAERLKIPLNGSSNISFYTNTGMLLAKGYVRVVIGGRGPYIEFSDDQIMKENIYIPQYAEHKLKNSLSWYWEYRSKDEAYVKLYYQRIGVSYADYKPDMWYISPEEVRTDEMDKLLLPPYVASNDVSEVLSPVRGQLFE